MILNLAMITVNLFLLAKNNDNDSPVDLSEADSGRVKHFGGVLCSPQIVSNSSKSINKSALSGNTILFGAGD